MSDVSSLFFLRTIERMTSQEEKALVVALVRAQIMSAPDNMSWVPYYHKTRWVNNRKGLLREVVGGHWRRKSHCKRSIDCLACVCQQEELARPLPDMPPVGRERNRVNRSLLGERARFATVFGA